MFIPQHEVQWKTVRYLERPDETFEYQMVLPEPLASWDVYGCWERERVHSMRDHLKPGMVLFDVGTEQGWLNLVYAQFVGPENMVLIEPTSSFWPNIRATWAQNFSPKPRACYDGLIGTETTDVRKDFTRWPTCSVGPLIDRNHYEYLHENSGVPQIRLDDLCQRCQAVPQAITIDVEGAELLVLRGARWVLGEYRPLVWVSVHPDLMERDYGHTPDQLHSFMASEGYRGTFLAEDHECHYLYEPL